ncbi:class II fumarate hydratase [Thalassotalea sp. G2M2-11]|uniref:class II fumarate hydratase n=1 Tax=Thalassotalea sp. G2M2-11 TaxID=2787627 RepID=UPI0019D1F3AF|nr:class II fumarate hydratase [Thalassotalea sp. G2M2-11]
MTKPTQQKKSSVRRESAQKYAAIKIEEGALWGEQSQRSLQFFNIGKHTFTAEFIDALVVIKREAAQVNHQLGLLSSTYCQAIVFACEQILQGKHTEQFPLHVWQTGSGTQTNMNVNEVIASLANTYLADNAPAQADKGSVKVHPNDHVNMSQSSNDTFPSAMHVVVAQQQYQQLRGALAQIEQILSKKIVQFAQVFTVGRTHLMDALPLSVGDILSGYHQQLLDARKLIEDSMAGVYRLALGGTAVGSGANAPNNFGKQVITGIAAHYQLPFIQHENLFAAVSGEDALMRYSSALKQLAAALFKIANDFRLLGSGPRCGLNEWHLPANEPGSSIMPGKVNPTQCEALTMVCLQVFGNDLTVSMAASNGQLQLNTYRPVIIHNVLESIELLTDAIYSFSDHCLQDLAINHHQVEQNIENNLSLITLLAPQLGYDTATNIVQCANKNSCSLAEAAETLGVYSKSAFKQLLEQQIIAQATACQSGE